MEDYEGDGEDADRRGSPVWRRSSLCFACALTFVWIDTSRRDLFMEQLAFENDRVCATCILLEQLALDMCDMQRDDHRVSHTQRLKAPSSDGPRPKNENKILYMKHQK